MKKYILLFTVLIIFFSFKAFAQPANNTCAGAITLTETNGSCTSTGYTNVGATNVGNPPTPPCWAPSSMNNTVWFKFVATGTTSAQISTNFPTGPGDMSNTQLAAYSGTCGSLTLIGCNEDINTAGGVTHTSLQLNGLTIGNTYYLIVDGNANTTGGFGICVQQVLPPGPPLPIQDCQTGQFLCNKNPLSVPDGTGGIGLVQESPSCFGAPGERAGWWYTFTCGTSGSLCINIMPNASVDYDFAVFNTTAGCPGTEMVCNWSGTKTPTPLTGPNGGGNPQDEPCLTLVAGQTYTILVDRFTATASDGFDLSFSGTATFASPVPAYSTNTVCVGTATQFTNTTTGSNTYNWTFGDGGTSTAQNPTHTYTAAGTYTSTLLVTTNPGGCQNMTTQTVIVNPVPTVNAGPDASVCSGLCVNLAGSTNATGSVGPTSFTNGGTYAIPDNNTTGVNSPIAVSGIVPATIAAGSIASVCLNITHTFDGDLDIFLVCPGGTQIELSTDNGGGSNNYTNTCFTVADPIITGGTAPFTGSYSPEQAFTLLNGCTANGTWNLLVKDDAGGDVGSITGWTITFNNTLPAFTWTPTTFMTGSTTLTPQVCPTATTTYTLNVTSGGTCTASDQVTITVPAPVTPTFAAVGPYCSGVAIPALPTTSTNGITGTWSPAINNMATTVYTFTPDPNQCATTTTLTITITPKVTPTFNAVGPYCSGAAIPALPTSSTNAPAITGTWSPAINNTATTVYTFTPTAGLCANTTTLTITINPPVTPTFTAVPPQCTGSAIAPLPTSSTNVPTITGTWSPAINNTATTVYTFTPDPNQCATTTTMTITITSSITPTFTAVGPYCSGAAIPALSTSSTNVPAITGTWSPAINNTATTLYTFTPAANQCATTTTLSITVNPNITPTFTAVTPICSGAALAALPTTSNNSITGTWSPAINNTATTLYTFTPDAGQCATTTTLTITVNPLPIPTAIADSVNCNGGSTGFVTVTGVANSVGPYAYSWNSVPVQNTQTATGLPIGTYTVTVTDQNTTCTGQTTATIYQPVVLTASETHVNPTCTQGTNGTATANPAGGTAPYTYSWNTIPVQTTQTATGLSAVSYTCTITDYHGCTTTTTATLVDPAGMVLSTSMTQANCGMPDGSATVSVTSGGSGNFSYSWNTSPVQNTATATAIPSGTYIATVTDVTLGCISTDTITVTTTLGITATAVFISDALCNGSNDGKAYAFPTGGAPIYSYSWNTVPVTLNDTVTAAAGTYTVTITDGSGCQGTASVTIGQPTAVVASITGSTDETCLGANNGTATAGGAGGTGTYTYSWNTAPTQTTQTATGLAPGTYIVTVFDNNLCADTASVTINPGPTMTASHTSTNVSCFGGSNGAINVTVLGAPGAISYNWMPGSIGSEDPIGLTAGTYTLTATSLGCSVNDTVTITQPTQLIAVLDSAIDVTCNGGADGHAHGSATGGTGAYTYSWNTVPVQNTSAAFGLPQGIYTLTVTDGLGCQSTINATIIEPAPLDVNTGSMPAYCGVDQGTVWAFPTNGTAPYTYIWDSSAVVLGSTDTLSGLYPGSYHLQVLDFNGCKFIGDVVVSPAPGGSASISTTTNVSCFGGSDGTATVSMSGAFPPYNYQWDATAANQITNPAIGLVMGTYGVDVTDAYGCVMSTTANITEPTQLTVGLTQNNTVCPNSCDGTATATPAGGTSPYFYSWNDPSSQITPTAVSLCLGTFTVQVTDDKGCLISDSIVISNPPAMELDSTFVEANCNQADGSAEVFITANGTSPFTFSWTDGVSTLSMTSQLSNVVAGTYFVTVTDFNLCSVTTSVTIPNLSGPQIDSTSFTDVLCFGGNNGTATVNVSGGTTPYTYLWNDASNQITPSATNLIAGTYVVNIFDDNGCNLSTSITINEPTQLTLTSGGIDPTCFGYADGITWVNALGGTMPYSYSWNDGANQQNDTAFTLTQGNYTATVIDFNGCIETATVVLTDPALFTINVNGTDVSCFGGNDGSAVVSENNGVSPFDYLWNDPSAQTSQTASGLVANTYNVTATDDDGCIANGSVLIGEPPLLTIAQDTVLDVSCNGLSDGFASVTVNGGTGMYNFTWDLSGTIVSILQSPNTLAAGTYLVTVSDDNGCTASMFITVNEPTPLTSTYVAIDALCAGDNSGYAYVSPTGGIAPYTFQWDANAALQQTDTAFNLIAGTYGVDITDDNGCLHSIGGIIINEPNPLNFVSTTSSPSFCGSNNGSASVSVGGGVGTLNYAWNSTPAQFTAIASNLIAGNYTVVVTDQNGCLDSTNVNVTDLGSPTVTIPTFTDVSCNGAADGTATADVTGGTTPYTYLWNNTNADSTLTATGLDALTYSITVTDSNGCVASNSITIQQTNALVAVIGTPTDVSCNGDNNGAATVMTAFGNPPYTYQWNDAASQTTTTASNLIAGTYIVVVTDSNLCTASDTVIITEPAILVVGLDTLTNVSCNGGTNGFIDINVSGGNSPYVSYVWTPNISIGQTANGLGQGSYDVVVTDTKGCTATNTYNITEPSALSITLDSIPSTCGNGNGSAVVSSTVGGTSPYTYSWNDPANQQTPLASNLAANSYTVIVKDNNNCSVTQSIAVLNLAGPVIDSITKTNVICYGESNGTATVFASGTGLSYLWTPSNQVTQQDTGLAAGVYSVTVTDVNGCTSTQGGINIGQPTAITADINMPATACYGQIIQLFSVANGGTPFAPPASPYNILWGPPFSVTSQGPLYDTVLVNTTYSIVVQDANDCPQFYNESVVVGTPLDVTASNQTICEGNSVGLSATTTGGNTSNPYVYTWLVYDSLTGNTSTPSGVVNPTNPANVNPTTTTDYMVYVSDGCSRNDTTAVTVTVNNLSVVTFSSVDAIGCPPLVVDFKATSVDVGLLYSWSFGDGVVQNTIIDTTYHIYNNSGTYDVMLTVTNQYGCVSSYYSPKHVSVYTVPVADFVADPQVETILNPVINFTNLSSIDVIGWYWDFGDLSIDTIQNPTHNYQDTGYYPVQLLVTNGQCKDSIIKMVQIKPDFFFAIPNTFTPDGDDLNEIFRPGTMIGVSEKEYNFYIFDRWGEKIWEGHDLEDGWDGTVNGGSKIAQTDTYVWLIKLKGIDGLKREYRGHVNLLK